MDNPLAQRILDIIYHDPDCRRLYKQSLTDWILDTQPRTAPLDAQALVQYLAAHQPELMNRLKINVRIKEELARALDPSPGTDRARRFAVPRPGLPAGCL